MIRILRATVTLGIVALTACSHSGSQGRDMYVEEQLAALAALIAPAGVAPETWAELKATLQATLEQRLAEGRAASVAPASTFSRTALTFDSGDAELLWGFYSAGDYNQDGEVNISDLTPLAVHLGENVGADLDSIQAVVDGDGNGQVNIADITPIGASLGARLADYRVYVSQSEADYPAGNSAPSNITPIGTVMLGSATGNPTAGRRQFGFVIPSPGAGNIYWVRPSDGLEEGTPSNMAGPAAPNQSSIALAQLSFKLMDGTRHEHSNWGQVNITFTGSDQLLYFNMSYNGQPVLTNIPVTSGRGAGKVNKVGLLFSLGVADGTVVTEGNVAYSLGIAPKPASARRVSDEAPQAVQQQDASTPDGADGPIVDAVNEGGRPDDTLDFGVSYTAEHSQPTDVVGHPPGLQTATAVTNSLTYLKKVFGMQLGEEFGKPLEPEVMTDACGETNDEEFTPGQSPLDWPERKDLYMQQHSYGIVTTVTYSLEEAMQALNHDWDVEMMTVDEYREQQSTVAVHAITVSDGDWALVEEADWDEEETLQMEVDHESIIRTNYNGDSPICTIETPYGERVVQFVIERPADVQFPKMERIADFAGINHSECRNADGDIEVAFERFFDQKLCYGILHKPWFLPEPVQVLDDLPSGAEVKIGYIGDTLNILYSNNFLTHQMWNFRRDTSGNWQAPVLVDSSLDGDVGSSLDFVDVVGAQFNAFYKFQGISNDVWIAGESAPGSNLFSAPIHLPGTYGQKLFLRSVPGGTLLGHQDQTALTIDQLLSDGTRFALSPTLTNGGALSLPYEWLDSNMPCVFFGGPGGGFKRYSVDLPAKALNEAGTMSLDAPAVSDIRNSGFAIPSWPAFGYVDPVTLDVMFWKALNPQGSSWPAQPEVMYKLSAGLSLQKFNVVETGPDSAQLFCPDATGYHLQSIQLTR